jgi:hypothetical protein
VSVSSPVVVDGPGVVLASPAQRAGGQPRGGGGVEVDGGGGRGDGGGQQAGGGPGGRGGVRPGGTVEADDGVEVNHATALVLGDLGERDPQLRRQGLVSQPGLAGESPVEGYGEAAPQFGVQALNRTEPV